MRSRWFQTIAANGLIWLGVSMPSAATESELPARYFTLLASGVARVEERLAKEPTIDLEGIEAAPGWKHFPSALLAAATLYSQNHPANSRGGDPKLLELVRRIGDLLLREHARGRYTSRLDHHRDTYMWLEAYRRIGLELDEGRRARWRDALLGLIEKLAGQVAEKADYPAYHAPFISTSPNHLSLWASTVYLGGKVFKRPEWERLGAKVLHRLAAVEQDPDGYWGELTRAGPTTGYDYVTATAVALYYEHSKDPAALEALRRSTDFHKVFTWPDGTPVETINDRNRHWYVSAWAHFGFSHFPDGRRYAEFLTSSFKPDRVDLESLGRFAQDALYFHPGPVAPIPQDQENMHHRLRVPAGIRRHKPWTTCLSGIVAPQTSSQWFLDRQGHLSVFHDRLGLILTGANSKHQPELATFAERAGGRVVHVPTSSVLTMTDEIDSLGVAYENFFAVIERRTISSTRLEVRFSITPTDRMADAELHIQLVLKPGERIETATGRWSVVGKEPIRWNAAELGPSIRHRGWTLKLDPGAVLTWPIYPYNPYRAGPETEIDHAVATLTYSLTGRQTIAIAIETAD
jgi:hypothetical protein